MAEREKPLVLVADDQEDVRNLVALQALKLAQEERPDAAVLDVMMPGMNGYEVVSRMRKAEETRHIPVLLLTARAPAGSTSCRATSRAPTTTEEAVRPAGPAGARAGAAQLARSIRR